MGYDFACPDWVEKLRAGQTPIADLPLDKAAAERAVGIFDYLRLPDVAGHPAMETAAGDWMRDIVRAIFGSVDPATGIRQVGEVFVLVPKKNSKTTSAAAIGLTFMLLNERPKADMLIVAPTQKIAETAFAQAKGMIDADPPDPATDESYLQHRLHVQDHKSQIVCRLTGARLMIRTFDAKVLTGAKPVFCLVDETHELGKIPYAADVFRQIRGGMLPFPESLLMQITTQSDHEPAGIFKSELRYARGVRDGTITDGVKTLPVLYEFPVEMQTDRDQPWLDPEFWSMVTPNLNRSITLDALQDGLRRAREDGPHEVIGWATQHLNVEVGVALHGDRWPGAVFWEAAALPGLTLDGIIAMSDVCTVGIDGGGMDDIASLAVIGRHAENGDWMQWQQSWAQPEVFEQRKSISSRLRDFIACGDLIERDSAAEIGADMAEIILRLHAAGRLPEKHGIGYDMDGPATGMEEIEDHPDLAPLISGVKQGYRLQRAVMQIPNKLKALEMRHCGQPMMAWAAGNAKMELIGSNWLVKKQAAGASKIDPLMATFDAATLMFLNPVAAGGSYLNSAELMVF